VDGKLTAGGADGIFQLSIPVTADIELALIITRAQIEAEVTVDGDGNITSIKGILGGAVPKKALEQAIDNLDDDALPIPKDAIKNILDTAVQTDIDGLDADGNPGTDGIKESASVAIKFEGIPAIIAGVVDVGGETTEGETTEGETTEGETTEGETTEGETTDEGTTEGETTDEGTTEGETTDEGTTEGETTDEGTTDEGTTDEGTTDEGTTDEGTTDEGTTDEGTTGGGDGEEPAAGESCLDFPTSFSAISFRFNALSLGTTGKIGDGIDVDGICSPPPAEAQCIEE
jgi:hypothetical protein